MSEWLSTTLSRLTSYADLSFGMQDDNVKLERSGRNREIALRY